MKQTILLELRQQTNAITSSNNEVYPKVMNWARKKGYSFIGTRANL